MKLGEIQPISDNIADQQRQRQSYLVQLVPTIYEQIVKDEVAETLKQSSVSQEFFGERVKEVIEEALMNEKEARIDQQMQQIASLRSQVSLLQSEQFQSQTTQSILLKEADRAKHQNRTIEELQQKNKDLENEIRHNENIYGQAIQEKDNEVTYLKQKYQDYVSRCDNLENDLQLKQSQNNAQEQQLHQLKRLYESLQVEVKKQQEKMEVARKEADQQSTMINNLKSTCLDLQLHLQKTVQDNEAKDKKIQSVEAEKQELIQKFDMFGEHLKSSNQSAIDSINQQHLNKVTRLEKTVEELRNREQDLLDELDSAKTVQVGIARRMKDDMQQVRDQWQEILSDKELQLKKKDAEIALKIQNAKSEQKEQNLKDIQSLKEVHAQEINKLAEMKDQLQQVFDRNLEQLEQECIKITEHERILNEQLLRLESENKQKLADLNTQIQSQLKCTLEQKLQESEQQMQQQVTELQKQMQLDGQQQIDKVKEQYEWKEQQVKQDAEYQIRKQNQAFDLQLEKVQAQVNKKEKENQEMEQQVQRLKDIVKEVQKQGQDEKVYEQQKIEQFEQQIKVLKEENDLLQFKVNELEQGQEYAIKKVRETYKSIINKMQSQTKLVIDDLRSQLKHIRSQLASYDRHQEDLSTSILSQTSKSARNLTSKICELLQHRDHQDQEMDALLDQLKHAQDKQSQTQKDKSSQLKQIKQEFISTLESAKQEVQRKYGFELKHLKRQVMHLKGKLGEQLESKEREIDQLQLQHQIERGGLEAEIKALQGSVRDAKREQQDYKTKYEAHQRLYSLKTNERRSGSRGAPTSARGATMTAIDNEVTSLTNQINRLKNYNNSATSFPAPPHPNTAPSTSSKLFSYK